MHSVYNLWLDNGPAYLYSDTGYLEDSFTTYTLTKIWEHDPSIPMFLFHPFFLPQVPYQIPIAWQQPFVNVTNPNRRKYIGMLFYMDTIVGSFVNALKVKNMYNNKLIIMVFDNGGFIQYRAGGNNYPLRGGEESFFDGGVRVNAFVAGGVIPKKMMMGKTITEYVHTADLYTTFLDFTGASANDMVDEKAKKSMKPL
jgi:arylsulfatase B